MVVSTKFEDGYDATLNCVRLALAVADDAHAGVGEPGLCLFSRRDF